MIEFFNFKDSSNKEASPQAPQTNKQNQAEVNPQENPIEKVNAEKISLLEKNLHSLESNNKELKQLICTIYRKYEVFLFLLHLV